MAVSKVMIVDDVKADLLDLEKIVSGAGYSVITAASGAQAIAKAKSEKPGAILMDVNMKEADGFSTTRTLQGDPATRHIPVVFVTAKDRKADRVWAQLLGARGYVTKPYSSEQLIEPLRAI